MLATSIVLLLLLQLKHTLADFPPGQNNWMAMHKGHQLRALVAHAIVHAAGTVAIMAVLGFDLRISVIAAVIEVLVHSLVDRAKTKTRAGSPGSRSFWAAFGGDQFIHHFYYFVMVLILIPARDSAIVVLFGLQIKHTIAEYAIRSPEGVVAKSLRADHIVAHFVGTMITFAIFESWYVALIMAIVDIIAHTVIDKLRMWVNKGLGTDSRRFWFLFGLDQCLHHFTYFALVVAIAALA